MPLDDENEVQQPEPTPEAAAPAEQSAPGETSAPELVPGRHTVRVWDRNTGKAIEVNRSIDTGNTLDIWI